MRPCCLWHQPQNSLPESRASQKQPLSAWSSAPAARAEAKKHLANNAAKSVVSACCSCKPAAVLLSASTTFFAAVSLTAEPLLACVVAGLITTNRRWAILTCQYLITQWTMCCCSIWHVTCITSVTVLRHMQILCLECRMQFGKFTCEHLQELVTKATCKSLCPVCTCFARSAASAAMRCSSGVRRVRLQVCQKCS